MILNLFDKAYEVAENTSVGDLLKAQMPDDWKKYLVVRLEDGTLCDLFSPIAHSQTVTPAHLRRPGRPQGVLPFGQPPDGHGRQAPVPRGEAGHRPRHRGRLLL